jgi:ParB/RepB/Spo0J family partition protein
MPELRTVPLSLIDEPAQPMREFMDEEKLEELKQSMSAIGLQQPIALVMRSERYEIVAGHRRFLCAQLLGWSAMMSLCYKDGEIELHAARIAENAFREDVTAAEEAIYYAELIENLKLDEAGLCAMTKRKADYIADRLRLLRGDPEILEAIRQRKIVFAVGRELNKCTDEPLRRMYLHQAIQSGCAARVVQSWIASWRAQGSTPTPAPAPEAAAAPAPEAQQPDHSCQVCGGNRDPWNLIWVRMHKWEWERIEAQLHRPPEAEGS